MSFSTVSFDEFRRISNCETSKEAWDTVEGTKSVKRSKLQMLSSRLEEIKMEEDETFSEFYTHMCDIVNQSFGLGEKIPEIKIIEKFFRSFP